jgi:hypothetical protein
LQVFSLKIHAHIVVIILILLGIFQDTKSYIESSQQACLEMASHNPGRLIWPGRHYRPAAGEILIGRPK